MRASRLIGSICLIMTVGLPAQAATVFFVESNSFNVVDDTRDQAFQTAVGNQFSELDLDAIPNAALVDALAVDGITIDIGLGGSPAGSVEIFQGAYAAGGGAFGTVQTSALLNRAPGVGTSDTMTFAFSEPVRGFGAWIFDDLGPTSPETTFTLSATEVGGATSISAPINGGNGGNFFVEGFLAVTSDVGLESVSIVSSNGNDFFEVDHLQIATVPLPAAAWLFGGALLGLVSVKRRRRVDPARTV